MVISHNHNYDKQQHCCATCSCHDIPRYNIARLARHHLCNAGPFPVHGSIGSYPLNAGLTLAAQRLATRDYCIHSHSHHSEVQAARDLARTAQPPHQSLRNQGLLSTPPQPPSQLLYKLNYNIVDTRYIHHIYLLRYTR